MEFIQILIQYKYSTYGLRSYIIYYTHHFLYTFMEYLIDNIPMLNY